MAGFHSNTMSRLLSILHEAPRALLRWAPVSLREIDNMNPITSDKACSRKSSHPKKAHYRHLEEYGAAAIFTLKIHRCVKGKRPSGARLTATAGQEAEVRLQVSNEAVNRSDAAAKVRLENLAFALPRTSRKTQIFVGLPPLVFHYTPSNLEKGNILSHL